MPPGISLNSPRFPESAPEVLLILQSRGPPTDPFSGLQREMATKNGFGPHLENGGNVARKMGKMARKWLENEISGQLPILQAICPPFSRSGQNPFFGHFRPLFRAGGPKWICKRSTGLQPEIEIPFKRPQHFP